MCTESVVFWKARVWRFYNDIRLTYYDRPRVTSLHTASYLDRFPGLSNRYDLVLHTTYWNIINLYWKQTSGPSIHFLTIDRWNNLNARTETNVINYQANFTMTRTTFQKMLNRTEFSLDWNTYYWYVVFGVLALEVLGIPVLATYSLEAYAHVYQVAHTETKWI